MKHLAVLAAACALLLGGALGTIATSARADHSSALSLRSLISSHSLSAQHLLFQRSVQPMQATTGTPAPAGTAVPTGTPAATPQPTSNPNYPDPVSLFQNMVQVYTNLKSAAYDEITDGEQTNVEKLHIDAKGNANCTGPSMTASVTGTDTLEGTSQTSKSQKSFVVIGKNAWTKSKSTKNAWKKISPSKVAVFGFSIDNPLACAPSGGGSGSGSGSGSGGSSEQLKNLINLGPDTINGSKVWHVQGTGVITAQDGSTLDELLDFYIGQDHPLLYKFTVTINDTAHDVTLIQTQILSKFGAKFTIKDPTKK